jgi:hypothetical protein
MPEQNARAFPPTVQAVIDEFVPLIKKWDTGCYAISVGGSQGKGTSDGFSDIDLRLFHEKRLPWADEKPEMWVDYFEAIERWGKRGVIIDGVWCRPIAAIDAALNCWLEGELCPDDLVWTVWGYHLLPDIYHQGVIEDPFGVIAAWKERLRLYPLKLKNAVLDKHLASLRYWRKDYHYQNKVKRADLVFLAGLSARLVHDMLQVLFALNETYFVGDGQNLDFAAKFMILPERFIERVGCALYPTPAENRLETQYDTLAGLIEDIIRLAEFG